MLLSPPGTKLEETPRLGIEGVCRGLGWLGVFAIVGTPVVAMGDSASAAVICFCSGLVQAGFWFALAAIVRLQARTAHLAEQSTLLLQQIAAQGVRSMPPPLAATPRADVPPTAEELETRRVALEYMQRRRPQQPGG